MIPRLCADRPAADDAVQATRRFFAALAAAGFRGEAEAGIADRMVFSTDNSIYRLVPQGIVFPRDADDLRCVARTAAEGDFAGVTLTMRGGGTGTNGQSLTEGIVIDCSRHMNRILAIDPERRIARVEAGVVKDQLNQALKPYGLFFAPELSTSNRATIGGMINTDACGQGSCIYGKTSTHVRAIRAILADGAEWWSRPLGPAGLEQWLAREDRIGLIHRTLLRIARDQRELIAATFPPLNRSLTGYDLAHLGRPDGGLDVNSVLCGSEGTLAMIAEAEVALLPIPAASALVVIRYRDFLTGLKDARSLAALKVASVETIDERVLGLAKGDAIWPAIAHCFPDDGIAGSGINIVEIVDESAERLQEQLDRLLERLNDDGAEARIGSTLVRDRQDIAAIWTMRKRAVGLLGNVEGPARPVPFVEDTAVPPENLAAYIAEFRALLDGEGLTYGMFGHVDAGVLHVRPALDLTRDDHVALVRKLSDQIVALTRKYGGVLWGEHGKGVRSEYVPDYFGALYPALEEIKRAFDPLDRLNPGKIAVAGTGELKRIDMVPLRGAFDRAIAPAVREGFDNAAFCNGNGACFDFNLDAVMCPSFKASGDRRHSPKGRATLIREWLCLLAGQGVDPLRQAEGTSSLLSLPVRIWNSLNPANATDFSHEVLAAMDGCLACKACASGCPVKVNVPAFRAKFLELYYGRYLRPLRHRLVALTETMMPVLMRLRPAYNLVVGSAPGRAAMALAGLVALPVMPAIAFGREIERRGVKTASRRAIAALSPSDRARAVVLVQDAFTTGFEGTVVLDFLDLATALGFLPLIAPLRPNGKALHVHGLLGAFRKTARGLGDHLAALSAMGVQLVGIDPSMTLAFRDEYRSELGAAPPVLLPQEWLARHPDRLKRRIRPGAAAKLLLHCTERTGAAGAARLWTEVFTASGLTVDIVELGCCGMAGTFGHEARNRQASEKIYDLSWRAAISAAGPQETLLATGYSCRTQVKLLDGKVLRHPVGFLKTLIVDDAAEPSQAA